MYVSTRDDGSIDPTTSNIATGNGLARVGSIFYTKENFDNAKTYVQDFSTDTIRTSTINTYSTAKNGVKIYNMPKARLVDNTNILMLNTEIYFNTTSLGTAINLPLSIDDIGSNYVTAVKGVIEATDSNGKNTFISNVAQNLQEMSSKSTGTSFLTNILNSISPKIKVTPENLSNLFPNSTEPLVGWVATVTPMFSYLTDYSYFTNTFWFVPDGTYLQTGNLTGVPSVAYTRSTSINKMVRLILDGYSASQYNYVSKTMFTDDRVNEEIYKRGVSIPASDATRYATYGLMRAEYGGTIFENAGKSAYLTDPSLSSLYGVQTSSSGTNWTDETIHLKGGITIADQPLDNTPPIPVYYYITPDPNNPITPPSTATPPTFTPEPPPGTVVTKVVIPTDNDLVEPDSPPDDFPDPITTPYKEITPTGGTYPVDPDNPPDHILVECKETDDIPIYYHVFTFNNTTGKTYADVFDFIKRTGAAESNATEQVITSTKTLKKPSNNKTEEYYFSTDSSKPAGEIVAALSTSSQ